MTDEEYNKALVAIKTNADAFFENGDVHHLEIITNTWRTLIASNRAIQADFDLNVDLSKEMSKIIFDAPECNPQRTVVRS